MGQFEVTLHAPVGALHLARQTPAMQTVPPLQGQGLPAPTVPVSGVRGFVSGAGLLSGTTLSGLTPESELATPSVEPAPASEVEVLPRSGQGAEIVLESTVVVEVEGLMDEKSSVPGQPAAKSIKAKIMGSRRIAHWKCKHRAQTTHSAGTLGYPCFPRDHSLLRL